MKKMKKIISICVMIIGVVFLVALVYASQQKPATGLVEEPVITGFKKTYAASVSDAVELVTGKRGFMSHDMRPVVHGSLVGRAVTSLVKPASPENSTPTLSTKHSVEMIDNAKPGEVGVIVMENGLDVAAIGNLMGTAAKTRGMAGMVLDGGVRDIADLRAMRLTVYARSVVPSTAVGRYATVARNIPVECAGVTVRPGDIIVADEDGVVVVPQERADEVLLRALEIDEREKKMYPLIRKYKGLQKAIETFNRI
jgi:regulator of RNase E activity RraA